MSDQHSFLSVDSYSRSQAEEHMLNTAITQAKIGESFEEYLEIFDKFYADDVQVSSETQHEPVRGKARVGSLEGSFMVSRLQRNEEPLNLACHHLEEYLETKVRARKSKGGARNS